MPAMKDIPSHFVTEYATNWEHLAQAKMTKMRECVTVDTVEGKEKKYNQFDSTEMDPVNVRAGDTRISDTNLPARWLRPYPMDKAYLFDEWDERFLGSVVLPQIRISAFARLRLQSGGGSNESSRRRST